ncbi:MAG: CCA tRNA nucleotidyltransferase [Hyphomicrobiales bacterium]
MTDRGSQDVPSLRDAQWLKAPELQAVMQALEADGEARVAGGAVRDALLGRPVSDVDVATDLTPDDVMRVLGDAGIKTIPTGIDHGTVTAVVGAGAAAATYEVTTLRVDVETFGRHAKVAFTDDWQADAGRRDFTMNALYCDRHGRILDPLGGYPDLIARRVRFAGNPSARIEEDYLRILRFFRFHAVFGGVETDAEGLAACAAHRGGLDQLSGERINQELFRLLPAPGAVEVVEVMADAGILEHVVPTAADVPRFVALCAIEAACGRGPDGLLRLAALGLHGPQDVVRLRERLVLTNAQTARLERIAAPAMALDAAMPDTARREALYRLGPDGYGDAVLFTWAASDAAPDDRHWQALLRLPEQWSAPALPLSGGDLVARGIEAGPRVGEILRAFERWWIDRGFPQDADTVESGLALMLERENGPGA